ncbi:MAG: biosynthetic-type acetolactate synthase large subunit [Polyangiaceae bacterium]
MSKLPASLLTTSRAATQTSLAAELALPELTGAAMIVEALIAESVDLVFGYPGGAIMPVYDALYDARERLHHVLVRHEQGAVHAAQGYARASGRVGVCIATSGPGATNLVTGIADAQIDSTPLVCLTGQVFSKLLGTDAFQETDVINVTAPITKWNCQVTRVEDIAEAMAKAFFIARTGRPGPVLLDITKDAQVSRGRFSYQRCTRVRSYVPTAVPSRQALEAAATLLNQAQRPLIIAGQGVLLSHGERELAAIADKTGAPVATTLLGLSCFDTSHPLSVGMVGMHGNYGPNIKTNECDVLLAVGMRFDDRVTGDLSTYAKQAKVIHIELDAAEINKNVKAEVALHGDAKETLAHLLPLIEQRQHEAWLEEFRACDRVEHQKVIRHEVTPEGDGLRMGEVVHKISKATHGEALVVSDVGQHQMAAARYSSFAKTLSHVTSGGLGTMGFGLPAAIGAKLGAPDRTVVLFVGDGGFQMTLQELGTLVQTGAAVKIVILNNHYLGMVRQWQELFFERRYSQTEMTNPDFVQLASAYGIRGMKVNDRATLESAIPTMLAHSGAFLLEVSVERESNVFPMVPAAASVSDVRLEP